MNQADATAKAAVLHYGDGEYVVMSPGGFVRCAVTQKSIALNVLRYWSAERQEPYASPLEYMQAHGMARDGRDRA